MASGVNNFKLLDSFDVEYAPASVKKWKSERTGLQVVLIDQKSPMVCGYFAVATEVEDDSGTPHTLEHLVFMGSKKYPYKGLLDILGNIQFSGTNAWTATDRTVYTLETAGWEGFNNLLPVYLDHVLNPTLTDEGYYTEVYHVDSAAKDKGVVYSEMEGRVFASWSLLDLELNRTLFAPKSGYSSETGGLLESLRVLTNQQIRDFHKAMYRPDNLCVIVTGSADEKELLETMIKFDAELPTLSEKPNPRPFVESPDHFPLKESVVREIEFPDTDESSGSLTMGFIGPDYTDFVGTLAFQTILSYLTEDSAALLQNKLVEIEDPLASDVDYYVNEYIKMQACLYIDGIDTENLHKCEQKTRELIKSHYDNDEFDLKKVRATLESFKNKFVSGCEKNPDKIAEMAMCDFMYGDVHGSDLKVLKDLDDVNELSKWTREEWLKCYKQYFIESPVASILAKPSAKLYEAKNSDDEKRIADRVSELGDKGLENLKAKLQHAEEANGKPIPDTVLSQFTKPDIRNIDFISTYPVITSKPEFHKNESKELHAKVFNDLPKDFPLEMYFDQYKSNFISLKILFSSMAIPKHLLPYMLIFQEIFTMPMVLDDGTEIPYEAVVEGLKNDFVNHAFSSGISNGFEEIMNLSLQFKSENYNKAIEWIGKLFFNSVFDQLRVKVCIDKFLNSLPETKRDGDSMLSYLSNKHLTSDRSLNRAFNILDIESFYRDLSESVDTEKGFKKIQGDLEEIRNALFGDINNYRVLVLGGIQSDNPVSSWSPLVSKVSKFTKQEPKSGGLVAIPHVYENLSELGASLGKVSYVLATPGSESSYLYSVSKLEASYLDEDYPAISMVKGYLQIIEGPFWAGIRGSGLAYHISISTDVESRELLLNIFKATDVYAALKAAKKVVEDLANGVTKFEQSLVDGTVSSIVNSFASSESNLISSATVQYVDNELRLRGPDYKKYLFAKLKEVTVEDMIRITKKYFLPLFDVETSSVFAVVNPKNSSFVEDLEGEGYKVDYSVLEVGDYESDCGSDCDCESGCASDCESCDDNE
ncbi:Sdd3 protein [Saccharomycopsis crataegensis]|uniref:Sdd3 protein n=1 Tax=Saccharomycopsis crataegensis TaxID=43959 RepID=A0AAV5QMP5_9ASCO|nr:Sdd3 protein [Saccharomycopsis crataegensis]